MPDISMTSDEAVAALTAAGWTEQPGADDYVKAITAVREFCAANAGAMIDPASVEHLIDVNLGLGSPRTMIHCFMSFTGCDWDLRAAVALARRDDAACFWDESLLGHELLIRAGNRGHWFDVRRPADV